MTGPTDVPGPRPDALAENAVRLVRQWLVEASDQPVDRAGQQLADLLADPHGLEFAVGFVDRVVRPDDHRVAARALRELATAPPRFLPWHLRTAIRLAAAASTVAPRPVVAAVRRAMRGLVQHLVLDARPGRLGPALARVRTRGVRCNLNLLGEAVLGGAEAAARVERTQELLVRDDVDYVSIKVSSTTAPHQPWAFDATVDEVVAALLPLYRAAAATGSFINLDMEEYRDLELTMAVFTEVMGRPEFADLRAGIVLQTYLPDALGALQRLEAWSAARVSAGGAPIKVRLVKGANLPMERIEAELHGWPLATFSSKVETDANYKLCLDWLMRPERMGHVQLGIAGHNLFDVAWSWLLAGERGVAEQLDYEMLLGMASAQAEVVRRHVGGLLLYTPIVRPQEFDVAIAYLVRRLDEGASADNFMSAVFDLAHSPQAFDREAARFQASLDLLAQGWVPQVHRVQDRNRGADSPAGRSTGEFVNTPDTDPSVLANQQWAAEVRALSRQGGLGTELVAASRVTTRERLEEVMVTARHAQQLWGDLPCAQRAAVLERAGEELEAARAQLMAVAADETGKTLDQSDPEVSEAVDFAHHYAALARDLERIEGARAEPPGVVLVTPPWNFPLAIPAGMVLSALAAGASVVLKPAPESERCAAVVAQALWRAGIPRQALSLISVDEDELGAELVGHPLVDKVMLTGGLETAELFGSIRPGLEVLAETSGKNAIIVTPSADLDLAAADVAASAFGHAGQKCSAASLVILVGQAARSRRFREQLIDAVTSLRVGWPEDQAAQMGPLVRPARGKLLRGLTTLGEGEVWVVPPRRLDDEGRLWSPGIRAGVRPGSEFHLTEYFGPILGVMSVPSLDRAIEVANGTDFGLTSGLHSLDPDEIAHWLAGIRAGNLYVNRGITGAIVQRQPFGGWKKSAIGPTAKAGGPNTLVPLVRWRNEPAGSGDQASLDPQVVRVLQAVGEDDPMLLRAAHNDQRAWEEEFGVARDVQAMVAERNVLRYLPFDGPALVRAGDEASSTPALRCVLAALRAGVRPEVSTTAALAPQVHETLSALGIGVRCESPEEFLERVPGLVGRLRFVGEGADRVAARASVSALAIWRGEVVEAGRVEVLAWLLEQSISITGHRFGTPHRLSEQVLATR